MTQQPDTVLAVRDEELTRLRYEQDQLREALATVTGQCRGLETQLAAARNTIDRVRDLAGRYQMWHEGGWAPRSAADVAREYRAALGEQPDTLGPVTTHPYQGHGHDHPCTAPGHGICGRVEWDHETN